MAKRRSTATKRGQIKALPALPRRSADAHKGDFGPVLVIGGSVGMVGAPALSALASLRSGAGLVTIAVPAGIQLAAVTLCPCATTLPLPETAAGQIDPDASLHLLEEHGWFDKRPDVVAVGPGVGNGQVGYARSLWRLIDRFRCEAGVPVVIDADALNLVATNVESKPLWRTLRHPNTVITPHPGEMARWHGKTPAAIQADRERFATETATAMGSDVDVNGLPIVVLKGAGTIVTDGQSRYVNKTGNPGMATGGTGDVLTGVIAALMAQGMTRLDAAVLGVHLHGLAGDIAAKRHGQISLIATDLVGALPEAFQRVDSHSRSRGDRRS